MMAKAKLTIRTVEAVRPSADGDVFLWDSKLAGFGLRVKPSGVKTFVVQYRVGTRTRRYAIGKYPALRPENARSEANALLGAIERGADPSGDAKAKRKAGTISEMCDRYFEEHATPHKKPESVKSDERLIKANIKPAFGTMGVGTLTRTDVQRLHHRMRETPFEANRTLALLSKMMNLAELWGLRPDGSNPCRHVKRYPEPKRIRHLNSDELAKLGKALAELERDATESPGIIAAVRLLALTGMRLGEVLNLKWAYVDLSDGVIRLPDAKAGARSVPIGAAARVLLAALKRDNAEMVIESRTPGAPLSRNTIEGAWGRIRGKAGLADARLHDLRHTVATAAAATQASAFAIRDLLGHKHVAMASRYVERAVDPLRELADQVSSHISGAMAGATAEVMELRKRHRG
jgi:integrase